MHKKDPAAAQRIKQKVFFILVVFWPAYLCTASFWFLPSCGVIVIFLFHFQFSFPILVFFFQYINGKHLHFSFFIKK
jgi:hypothetical protein